MLSLYPYLSQVFSPDILFAIEHFTAVCFFRNKSTEERSLKKNAVWIKKTLVPPPFSWREKMVVALTTKNMQV